MTSQLNSFGSILTFAIDLETRIRDYYASAMDSARAAGPLSGPDTDAQSTLRGAVQASAAFVRIVQSPDGLDRR